MVMGENLREGAEAVREGGEEEEGEKTARVN